MGRLNIFSLLFLASAALSPVQGKTKTDTYTRWYVPVTYSFCFNRTGTTTVSVPPVTETAIVFLSEESYPDLSPVTTFTSTMTVLTTDVNVYPVAIVDPSDVHPTDLATASTGAQPASCLTATASVDYRSACATGQTYQMRNPSPQSTGVSCGRLNPCCYRCFEYSWSCLFGDCSGDPRVGQHSFRCPDGREYFEDGDVAFDKTHTRLPSSPTSASSSTSTSPRTSTSASGDSTQTGSPTAVDEESPAETNAAHHLARIRNTDFVTWWSISVALLFGSVLHL